MNSPIEVPDSLWLEVPQIETPAFSADTESDVVIVGGGITGLTLAYTLAESGASVVLLEAGALAGAASGRNAGFILAAPAEPHSEAVAMWGRAGARAVVETGRRTHQRIRDLIETLSIQCEYRAEGSIRLARTEEEAEDQRASIPLLEADGFSMREVPPAQALPGGPHERYVAAFLFEEDGELHPVRFLHGVARAAIARGARVFAHSEVRTAQWNQGLWEARTAGGVARGRALVMATNAYASRLCPELAPVIAPRRGQMLATAPIARVIAPRPTYAHWGYEYWRQTPDGRLVIGGWRNLDLEGEVGFDSLPQPRIQSAIERGLSELVPEGAAIERRWAGIMGFSRDGRPLVGWLDAQHHLAICAGFTGHGMGMAAACTQDLAQLLAFRKAEAISTFDPARFPELRSMREGLTMLGAASA